MPWVKDGYPALYSTSSGARMIKFGEEMIPTGIVIRAQFWSKTLEKISKWEWE